MSLDDDLLEIRKKGDHDLPFPSTWNQEYSLRPYQNVGSIHLAMKQRYVLGDPVGTGKTPTLLHSYALVRDQLIKENPLFGMMVVTTKSATRQWVKEMEKFTPGLKAIRVPSETPSGKSGASVKSRVKAVERWVKGEGDTLVLNWSQFSKDLPKHYVHIPNFLDRIKAVQWVGDECQKMKNPESAVGATTREVISLSRRSIGLTATLVQNQVKDAFEVVCGIAGRKLISDDIFNCTYCEWGTQSYSKFNPQSMRVEYITQPLVTGYNNLDQLYNLISPYYLVRLDNELEGERPQVMVMHRSCTLRSDEWAEYLEVEKGLTTGAKSTAGALTKARQAVSAGFVNDSGITTKGIEQAKERLVKEIMKEEINLGEPCIFYSPFSTVIDKYMETFSSLNPVKVTGSVSSSGRADACEKFQSGETDLIMITDAGGEGINLQRAKHIFMLTRPYPPGAYTQVVGRGRRVGSQWSTLLVWHPTVENTVDEYVDALLATKFKNSSSLLGEEMPFENPLGMDLEDFFEYVKSRRKARLNS